MDRPALVVQNRRRDARFLAPEHLESERKRRREVLARETRQDLTKINTGIDYLRFIEGEKHLVYVAEGTLFLPRLENDYSVAAAAN